MPDASLHRSFHRPLAGLVAVAVTLSAAAVLGAPLAVADPRSPDVAPSTTITPVAIPTATSAQKTAGRKQLARERATTTSEQAPGTDLVAALPEQTTKPFSTIGVTWTPSAASDQAKVQVRTRAVDGDWTGWTALENESDDSPAEATRVGTAPVYVGESDGVEVRVSSDRAGTTLAGLQLSLIDSPEVAADAHPATVTAAAAAATPTLPALSAQPTVVSRKGWGADESWRTINGKDCATPDIDDTIEAAVVHHTAGSNTYTAASVPSIMRGMYAYHVKTQGWCDIGYNFVVDKYGKLWEGRAGGITVPVHGAHATSWNTDTVGISMIGNYETATPSSAAMESLAKLIAWKLEGNYRSPTSKVTLAGKTEYRIFGHGDVMSTSCPGANLRSRLGALRSTVAAKIGSFNTPIYQKWQAAGGDRGAYGSPHVGEAKLSDGRYTRFTAASLYYKPSLGTYEVHGKIREEYDKVKATTSYLGWPTSDQLTGKTPNSRVSRFQDGRIYWSSSTGAHQVYRTFYRSYLALGEDGSALGLPLADQVASPLPGGQEQKFAGGYLVWTGATGPQVLKGGIGKTYMALSDASQRTVGAATGAEQTLAPSVWRQTFTHGAVYWHSSRGFVLHSGIWTAYAGLGAETSRLGLPTSNHYAVSGGQAATFQGGTISWNSTTGATTVTYR